MRQNRPIYLDHGHSLDNLIQNWRFKNAMI